MQAIFSVLKGWTGFFVESKVEQNKAFLPKRGGLAVSVMLAMTLSACGNAPSDQASGSKADATSKEVATVSDASNQKEENSVEVTAPTDLTGVDVVVATDPSNAPFEMRNSDGSIIGLDVELIDAIAKAQGFTYGFKPQKWQGIFNNLDDGSSDMVSGIVVQTEERQAKYDFTDPIFYKKRFAYMKPEIAEQIKTFADICQFTVAVKEQTDKSDIYDKTCGATNPKRQGVVSNYDSFRKVASGAAQIALGDDVIFSYYMKDNGVHDLVTIPEPQAQEIVLAWPVKKGNTALLEKFNAGLKTIKANGTYDRLLAKWIDKADQKADGTK